MSEDINDAKTRAFIRKVGFRLAAMAIGVSVAILAAELGLRLVGIEYPVFARPDPTFGKSLIPGAEGWQTLEGRAWVRINRAGFRDHERSTVKPPQTYRIAVLGDSFAEAREVDIEETFWSRMQDHLAQCPERPAPRVEVLNFGVSGYNTAQQFLLLEKKVWSYEPDLVLLAFFSGNDVADNHPVLSGGHKPLFVFDDGRPQLDTRFLDDPVFESRTGALGTLAASVMEVSRAAQAANEIRINLRDCTRLSSCGPFDKHLAIAGEPGIANDVFKTPVGDWSEAWRFTEGTIGLMHESARRHGAQFAVVTLTQSIQVNPDLSERESYMKAVGVSDLRYPERRMTHFSNRIGIPILTLAEPFSRHALATGDVLHGFPGPHLGTGHWNENGHRLAASLVSEWMCDRRFWRHSALPADNAGP